MPAVLALDLLVFIRAIEAFEVPALVGLPGKINVLTTDIYLDLSDVVPPDFGHASSFSVFLLVIAGILLAFYSRLTKSADRYQTVTGKGFRARMFDLGRSRHIATAVILVNCLVILVLALLWASFLPFFQPVRLRGLSLLTLENYRAVLDADYYLGLLWNTLFVAAVSATAAMAITLVAGWFAARRKAGAWVLDQLATMPLAVMTVIASLFYHTARQTGATAYGN